MILRRGGSKGRVQGGGGGGGGGAPPYISVAGAVEHWFGTRRGKAKSYVIRELSATQDNQLQDKTGTCYAHVISFPHGYRTQGQTGEL